jgi:hypothetical protein
MQSIAETQRDYNLLLTLNFSFYKSKKRLFYNKILLLQNVFKSEEIP